MKKRHPLLCLPACKHAGFTLIELMIVVAVVAVLTAIAYPSYVAHVQKSRRADAKSALLDLAAREERLFSVQNKYSSTAADLGYSGTFPQSVQSGSQAYYQLTVDPNATTATAFKATATPIGAQGSDKCGTYVLDQQGNQSNNGGSLSSADCW